MLDASGQLVRRRRAAVVRQNAGQELVEHDAQREHVGRHRHIAAKDLLRRRVSGREHAAALARELRLVFVLVPESLAMPKSRSFTWPSGVTRMFDGFRSRCTTRLRCAASTASQQDGQELQPILQRQAASAAVIGDRLSFHSLHDEVRPPVGGLAGIEKPRDAGVLQARQDSPLTRETAQDLAASPCRA